MVQIELPGINSDRHSRETRKAAMNGKREPLLLRIAEAVRQSGIFGMTRDEIAIYLNIAPTSPCAPCLALLKDGELIETAARRPTRFGGTAVVMVHRDFRNKVGE